MGDPITWYALGKDVADPTTIEEQIGADILVHNVDPSAHGQSSETVYIHRNTYAIDHPVSSVYARHIAIDLTNVIEDTLTVDRTITAEFSTFEDITGLNISFQAGKLGKAIIFIVIFASLTGTDADPIIRLKVTTGGATSYYPDTDGWLIPAAGAADISQIRLGTFTKVIDFSAGPTVIQVQASRSTTDETLVIKGVPGEVRSSLAVITVGADVYT